MMSADEFGHMISNRALVSDKSNYDGESYDEMYDVPLFYKILKYGIFTLYLILFVELVRHNIDHASRGRPFFTAVLLMVYSELATLGIVEFGVFLWGKYGYIDKEIKKKFADVHFALFLTAIFNALQYSLTSIVSTRLSNGLWVKTEQLELDHYVEIREEYERVQQIMDMQYTGCGKWFRNFILFVCRPGLRRRYESLRVQVRFHELRLHFLDFNNLPYSLKVSDYLKRSELSILIGLVHVSVATWVLLIGILNLGYFTFGMIGYATSKPGSTAVSVAILFFVIDVLFIALSLALRWKMRKIFQTVMKTKVIETSNHEEGIENQNQLFWFGSPPLVIFVIQLMNFGYAILISIVFIYWEYLNDILRLRAEAFLIVSVGCYIVFLYNLSALLPEYTLCTSLGYLTNQKELQETVATHRLEEAARQRRKKIIDNATVHDSAILQAFPLATLSYVTQNSAAVTLSNALPPILKSSVDEESHDEKDEVSPLLVSDLVKVDTKALRKNLPEESRESLINREARMRHRRLNRKKSQSDGVAAMRAWNQRSGTINSLETKEVVNRNLTRRSRMKRTASQPGVIQSWRNMTVLEEQKIGLRPLDGISTARIGKIRQRRKSSSDPRAIKAWSESPLFEKRKDIKENDVSFEKAGPILLRNETILNKEGNRDMIPSWKRDRLDRLAARKRARKKSQSASAVIQSWQDYSTRELATKNVEIISDENYNSSDLRALSSDEGSDDNKFTPKVNNNCSFGEKNANLTPLDKQQFNHRTQADTKDHRLVIPFAENVIGATNDTRILSLSDASIIDAGKDCNVVDDLTVGKCQSVGDLSDIDVIQVESVGITSDFVKNSRTVEIEMSWYAILTREVKQYFVSSIYRNVSHVIGTSVVFCLIGYRVEVMIKTKGTLDETEIPLVDIAFFWLEATFLFCFIIVDFVILFLFPVWKYKTEIERILGFATIIDVFIVGIVISLLFIAEAHRCCTKESYGAEFGIPPKTYIEMYEDNNCPRWGARTCGGLGVIEPFTSLILLRLFRFHFGHILNLNFYRNDNSDKSNGNLKSDLNTKYETNHGNHDGRIWHDCDDDHAKKPGSALELWESAISEFPDIVQKYGHFSGELLQAMLGLEDAIEFAGGSISAQSNTYEMKKTKVKDLNKCDSTNSRIKLADSRYAKLTPRAQGIVIAGSLQKPVKPIYPEEWGKTGIQPSPTWLSRSGLVDFEIDDDKIHSEQNISYNFVAPFARLVRSMRRCDRRHLPLLKEWMSVDVAMTQFEIVYFEAVDDYYSNLDEETQLHCEACRLALIATKGGKNLRLCDVALGRKVVGHLDFADVSEVHVARDDAPVSDMTLVEKAAVLFDKEQDLDVEHWSNLYSMAESKNMYARIIRWSLIQEERLKISTNSGTLYFRFYSDLANFEAKRPKDTSKNNHTITSDIAFQWAKTISRICGRSQLQQKLPHFGEENEAELQDYLTMVNFHEKEAENERKNITRGVQNVGNVELLFVGTDECVSANKRTKNKSTNSAMKTSFPHTS